MLRVLVFSLGLVLFHATPVLSQLQSVDPMNRASVVSFWDNVYQASEGVAHGWTGNIGSCTPGTITQEYRDAGLLRAQYFRAMVGLPTNITFHATSNAKCQESALMMTANGTIDHFPPMSWTCHTADGAEAAQKSNLAIGFSSLADAMDAWVIDNGISSVGHRRWILYPPQEEMGVGVAFGSGSTNSQVLWVFGSPGGGFGTRPLSPEWVAWPPEGFVPNQLVPDFWSFSYDGADFGSATVTMSEGGSQFSVTLETVEAGFGDNTLVWTQSLPAPDSGEDITYSVTIDNVMISGSPRSFSYDVTVIDPAVMVPTRKTTWGAIKNLYQEPDHEDQ